MPTVGTKGELSYPASKSLLMDNDIFNSNLRDPPQPEKLFVDLKLLWHPRAWSDSPLLQAYPVVSIDNTFFFIGLFYMNRQFLEIYIYFIFQPIYLCIALLFLI